MAAPIVASPPPAIPSIEASVIAEQVAPNAKAWQSDAEDLRKENKLLREEIDRLKGAKKREQSHKEGGSTDSPRNNERSSGGSDAVAIYTVTAYTANQESTNKSEGHPAYGITASGKPVQAGVTVACAPDIPFGTRLEIEGVGERVCTDRGGAIKGNRIDVYMPELADAREFGRQALRVRIINEGER